MISSKSFSRWRADLQRTIRIAPSILSADFAHLSQEIEKVERGGADILHLDVMDGHFVPNITIGPPVIASIRKSTNLPLDAHLMIASPASHIESIVQAGANWISVHVEADPHLNRTIHYLKERGVQAGVAINPATPLSTLDEILPDADFVLIMTVNPGFGGQRFIPSMLEKIRKLRDRISSNSYHARIEVDGGIGPDNLQQLLDAGADVIVVGSAIFNADRQASDVVAELKAISLKHSRLLEAV